MRRLRTGLAEERAVGEVVDWQPLQLQWCPRAKAGAEDAGQMMRVARAAGGGNPDAARAVTRRTCTEVQGEGPVQQLCDGLVTLKC